MPVPMMFAMTMEDAVTKPIVRRGRDSFRERTSATFVMAGSTIAFECMISEWTRDG